MKKFSFKKNKKNFIMLLVLLVVVCISGTFIYRSFNEKEAVNIYKILESESYSYLPKEVKNYIKDIYDESGEIILTEKSKEDNKPYLNPEYIEYLELSEEEREKVELIPDAYILDYSVTQSYTNSSLPSSYDLRNQNGYNYVSQIKDQGTTSLCWAFASVENVETLYMKNNNQSYSDLIPKFSIRQMDYITSTEYLVKDADWISCSGNCSWYGWDNPDNGSHELDKGGNFYVSSIAMANGITLTDESILPWFEGKKPIWAKDIYGYDKSLYEVDSTINMPTIIADSAPTELIDSYVSDMKTYMMKYGGPFVGTYSPQSTCGFENIDGTKVLKTDDCVNNDNNKNLGHAMQIIGWDDEYEYSYCEYGTNHYSVNSDGTCSKGELASGKGAWIIRNSWRTETAEAKEYSYVYLTYDSTRLSVGFTTSISDMKTRIWDNNYHSNPWIERKISNGMLSVNSQTKEFNTHNNNSEKVEKIKFLTSSKNGKYNISIFTEKKNYNNIATIITTEAGIYTIALSDKNIILDDKIFSVKVEGENEVQFINDSISVFTSNTNDEPSLETHYISGIETYEDPEGIPSEDNVAFVSSYGDVTIKLEHYLKNISDYKKITYKAILNGVDHSRYFFETVDMIYLDGHVTSNVVASKEDYSDVPVCGQIYTFQILYDDVVIEEFPLKRICDNWNGKTTDYTTSKIRFHKNDGSGYFSTVSKNDTSTFKIMKSDGTGDLYIGAEENFFLYDRYIKSWNTKPDGTGDTYTDNAYFVYKDMDFYAQWSDPETEPHRYKISWECSYGVCATNRTLTRENYVTFNKEIIIPNNPYTNLTEGKEFIYWSFDENDDKIFYEEEKTINITEYGFDSPYNDEERVYLEAIWSDSYYSINFDANKGSGTMKGIKIIKDRTSRLKYNLFERPGYTFIGWNTKSDGTGTSYTDGQKVSLTEDITLYAQWEENQYKITFNSNGGIGTMSAQPIGELVPTKLDKNSFTRTGYNFIGWNTKSDGTGSSYADEQEINISKDLVLYAQWTLIKYTVNFDANGGTFKDDKTTLIIEEWDDSKLKILEQPTREGYDFKGFFTEKEGGTSLESYIAEAGIDQEGLVFYAQWVEKKFEIKDYKNDIENNYITHISEKTKLSTYKTKFEMSTNYQLKVYDKDNKELGEDDFIFTGSITKILNGDNVVYEFINVVRGDVNGTGTVTVADVSMLYSHIRGTTTIKEKYYLVAGDVNDSSDNTVVDVSRIYSFVRKGISLF